MRTNAAEYLLAWVWQTTWQSGLLAIAVWVTTRLLRRWLTPQARQLLWLLVFLRLVMPSLPGSRLSAFSWIQSDQRPQPVSTFTAKSFTLKPLPSVDRTIVVAAPAASNQQSTTPGFPWSQALLTLWITGAAIVFGRVVVSNLRFTQRLKLQSSPADVLIGQLVAECCSATAIRRTPEALVTDLVTTPSLFGIFTPRLLLPTAVASNLEQAELRMIIIHELEHMRRRHLLVDWLLTAICSIHWFNPFAWRAHRQIRAARELICDRSALADVDDDLSRRYCLAMLSLAAGIGRQGRSIQLASFAQERDDLKQRIEAIASRRRKYIFGLGAIVVLTVAAVFLTRPAPPPTPLAKATSSTTSPSTEAIAELVRVSSSLIDDKDYGHALPIIDRILALDPRNDYALGARPLVEDHVLIAQQRAARDQYDKAIRNYPATNPQRIPYSDLLKYQENWPNLEAQRAKKTENDKVIAALERTLPELKFDQVPLSEVIEFLRDVSSVSIFVNWRALEAAGIDKTTPVTARLRDVKPSKALDIILRDVGGANGRLGYSVDEGVLTISTAKDLAGNVVTNVYDIRDLIVATVPAEKPPLVASIIKLIQDTIATESWKDNAGESGTIRELAGQLIVTQTPDNQRLLAALLTQLRETRAIQISLETCLIEISEDKLAALIPAAVSKKLLPTRSSTTQPGNVATNTGAGNDLDFLDDKLAHTLRTNADKATPFPRLTLYHAQQFISTSKLEKNSMTWIYQATVSNQGRYATVSVGGSGTYGEVEFDRRQTTFSIPDGATSLIRISPKDHPNTGNLWMLIKPSLILQREADRPKFPLIKQGIADQP